MEAPELRKVGQDLCPKCFEATQACLGCTDPDCPLADDLESGPESTVYPELAKANLYRMRGEYKLARDTCLSLLKRYPRNATAHTLLGDIETEEGDLEHAAQWYDMALELKPESEVDRHKLDALRRRLHEREAAATAEQLGLPTTRSKALLFATIAIVFICAVGAVAFMLGDRFRANKQPTPNAVTTPINIAGEEPKTSATGASETKATADPPRVEPVEQKTEPDAPVAPGLVTADAELQRRLGTDCVEGSRIVAASEDPRDKSLLITIRSGGEPEDDREMAAMIAVSALEHTESAPKVVIKVLKGDTVGLIADVTREAVQGAREKIGELGPGKHDRDALLTVLSNVWSQ